MPRRVTPPTYAPLWALLASVLAVCTFFLAPGDAKPALRTLVDLLLAGSVVVALRVRRPAYATPWWWVVAGLLLAAAGDAVAVYYVAAGDPLPFPSFADVAYLLATPAFAVAVCLVARRRGPVLGLVVEAAIVSTGAGLLGSVYLMTPHLREHATYTHLQETVAATYPTLGIFLLMLLVLVLRAGLSRSLLLLTAGALVLVASEVVFLVGTVEETYHVGALADGGFLLGCAFLAAAAWDGDMGRIAKPVRGRAPEGSIGRGRVALLFVAGLTFPAVLLQSSVQHADRVRVWSVAASSTVLLALVFVRLYLVVAEDSALRARQDLVERQTQFATMAAHELRTPLTSLRGSLGTLQRARGAGLPVPDQEELVQMAVRQADRLARLCADLDVIVQSDVGAVAVTHDRVVVRAVAEDVVASLGATALRRTSIAVPDDVTATADPDRLAQVLDNLVRNALRHAPGSPVRIGAVRDGASVHVDVADDGPGLSPEVAAGAFELFRLRDGDATGGFGIGLWIVHELVTAMAGEVSYDGSRGGARFRVTLPAATR